MRADRVRYRSRPTSADLPALRHLVDSTGVFYGQERAVALELLEVRLARGPKSGYAFFFAERRGELLGYAAWGNAPLTRRTFDLYWIVVAPAAQGQGIGRALLRQVERAVGARGGGSLYIETSSRKAYVRTRRFYREAGYAEVARLRDYYAPGDHKVMFCKAIPTRRRAPRTPAGAAGRVAPQP
ncbi:MAG: GNAT family N-acetyltransferase [Lysobacterales bacterium]|nr:MAG: GNAT family N-acetyltransferase [Xanthomonadales bacterium]